MSIIYYCTQLALTDFFFLLINLFNFIYLFLAALGLRCCTRAFLWLRRAGGGYSSLRYVGFSLWWLLLLGAWALGEQAQ